jgi:predicted site-specific integrase-resolvase
MLEKMTLQEAGEALGISPDAVRMRVKRGTMRGEKDAQGRWQVWIDLAEQEGEQEGEQGPERRSVDDVDDLRLRVAVLEAQLEATEDERDFLRQQVQTLTMAQAVMAQAQAQKALEPEKKPRRWRWPWQREAKS